MHSMGYIKKGVNSNEKAFFLEILDKYRKGQMALNVAIQIMRSWVIRFDEKYLGEQTFFEPYPNDLMDVETVNECISRDFWK
jgi:uncharacterized protein YbgA (DUF1722 family)